MKENKLNRMIARFLTSLSLFVIFTQMASATTLQSSQFYKGTVNLINQATSALTILCPMVGGVCAIYFAIRRQMADEQDKKTWYNRIVGAIGWGVGGCLLSGVITLIASYYK